MITLSNDEKAEIVSELKGRLALRLGRCEWVDNNLYLTILLGRRVLDLMITDIELAHSIIPPVDLVGLMIEAQVSNSTEAQYILSMLRK